MRIFSLEHSKRAYVSDFLFYATSILVLVVLLVRRAIGSQPLMAAALVGVGFVAWTLVEYLMHRFVLHAWSPFDSWHARHHDHPGRLLSSPTILSGSLIVWLVFVPVFLLAGILCAEALTTGLTVGYLYYSIVHHATHHWRASSDWLRKRKRWHALHHHRRLPCKHFGVTTDFWDRVFGSAG